MRTKLSIVVVFLFCCITNLLAQDLKVLLHTGDKSLRNRHYRKALPLYNQVLKTDPENLDALYGAGICNLFRYSKESALQNFEKIYSKDSLYNKNLYYWLGRAYHQNYQFSDALKYYAMYKTKLTKWDSRQKEVDFYMDQVKRARDYVANPKDYLVKNMGPAINSSYSEHSPVTSLNDTVLLFTSRKDKLTGTKEDFDGEPFEDIFVSNRSTGGQWSEPALMNLNTTGHDASIQLFDNDTKLFVYRYLKGGDIYVTEKVNGAWAAPTRFANINSRDFESDAFITPDGNTVFYATNHYKKTADLDIYFITKKGDGSWSKPKQLKGKINSLEDEDAPFITPDGKTMYFSSRGHNSMGGYDVFKSVMDENGKWSKPENLGYPINTPDDDVYYYRSSVSNRAYLSSYRDGGFGEKDIYEIIPVEYAEIKGLVLEEKTNKAIQSAAITFIPQEHSSKNANANTAILNASGNFAAPLLSNNIYKVVITKGRDTLSVDTIAVPLFEDKGKEYRKNFYVPFSGNPADTITVKKDTVVPVRIPPKKLEVIYFATNSYDLGPASKGKLQGLVDFMNVNPGTFSVIYGFTDGSGSEQLNKDLSANRADAIREYLKSRGVDPNRIKTEAFGANKPVASNDTEEGKAKNRRVEVTIE